MWGNIERDMSSVVLVDSYPSVWNLVIVAVKFFN